MAQNIALIQRIVGCSICIAKCAGNIIKDVMSRGELNIVDKGKNDLQTEADRAAQTCIMESLSNSFPNIKIIGEEGDTTSSLFQSEWIVSEMDEEPSKYECPPDLKCVTEQQVTVWVDPLDGTSEYTLGLLDHVTILIGIAVGERAVAGVIHQPYYENASETSGRTIWGIKDIGIGGTKIIKPPENCTIVVTTRSHSNDLVQAALNALNPDQVFRVGGAGHKVLLLLDGKAHAYVFASGGCKRWDTCAPEAILNAAGGYLTDIAGNLYSYDAKTNHQNTGGVLATAMKEQHSKYQTLIPAMVVQALK